MQIQRFMLIGIIFIPLLLMLLCVRDLLRTKFKSKKQQLVFLMLIVLVPVFGPVIYFFTRDFYVAP